MTRNLAPGKSIPPAHTCRPVTREEAMRYAARL